jgi:hypothetical protein
MSMKKAVESANKHQWTQIKAKATASRWRRFIHDGEWRAQLRDTTNICVYSRSFAD